MLYQHSMRGEGSLPGPKVQQCYEAEAENFALLFQSENARALIDSYALDYSDRPPVSQGSSRLGKVLKNGGVLDATRDRDTLWEIFASAQLAVCCDLLSGSRIDPGSISADSMRGLGRQFVLQSLQHFPDELTALQQLTIRLEGAEGIRVKGILEGAGLIRPGAAQINQLCLGAGSGYKELDKFSSAQSFSKEEISPLIQNAAQNGSFVFHSKSLAVQHTTLIDLDPMHEERYRTLNEDSDSNVLALNMDVHAGIETLRKRVNERELSPRNRVLMLRLDHQMVRDAERLIFDIGGVIGDLADLVITIGSGNNAAEFEGRVKCCRSIENLLKSRGLRPLRFQVYSGDSYEEQVASPVFGVGELSNYEILYCRLIKKKLLNTK